MLSHQKEHFSSILLRMGTFHTICNAVATIRKGSQDAGLKDVCTEAETAAEKSLSGVIDRKHYDHAVLVQKRIYEAQIKLQ